MLPKDFQILDLGGDNWKRLLTLFTDLFKSVSAGAGPLLVIYRGLKLLRAIDLEKGMPVEVDWRGTSRLDALSRESGYPTIVALEETAVARILGHAQRELNYDDDYFEQLGAFLRGFSHEWKKTVFTCPPGPARIPVLSHRVIDAAARMWIPDDSLVMLVVTENGRIWTSAVLGYRAGEFWLLTSLDTIGSEEGDASDAALEAAAEALRSKYGGRARWVAIERGTLFRIVESPVPAGSILWAINARELRTSNIPLKWKLSTLALAVAASVAGGPARG